MKIIPQHSLTQFKVIRSNIQIAITLPQIARFHSNLVQSFIKLQPIHSTQQIF